MTNFPLPGGLDDDPARQQKFDAIVSTLTGLTGFTSGDIKMSAATVAPSGWLFCDGSAVSRTSFAALFGAIGTAYGAGDGSTSFNLPDLRQRFPLGKAAGGTGSTLGGAGGAIDHTHGTSIVLPNHVHSDSHTHTYSTTAVADGFSTAGAQGGATFTASTSAHTHTVSGTTADRSAANTGNPTSNPSASGTSDANNPPYQVVNYLIKV